MNIFSRYKYEKKIFDFGVKKFNQNPRCVTSPKYFNFTLQLDFAVLIHPIYEYEFDDNDAL